MEGTRFVDIYATKGIEYLIVIAFFAAFALFCRYLHRPRERHGVSAIAADSVARFRVPSGLFYHQGHGWLRLGATSTGVVGIDDFARKLVGKVDAVELPPVGSRLEQGETGWSLVAGSERIPMLSPVTGEVVEVNREVVHSPGLLSQDPYGNGWLLKVKSPKMASAARTLLSGKLARTWMESAVETLQPVQADRLGTVLPDGGLPLDGVARIVGGARWADVARTHLLTKEA